MPSPAKFVQETKQEVSRVTWPTRKETIASTFMVLVMVSITALFFFVADWIISSVIQAFLGI